MVMMSIVIGTMIRITIGGAGEKSGAGSGEKLGELGEKLPGCIFWLSISLTLPSLFYEMIGQRQDFVFAEQHGRLKRPLTAPWWE